jgi:DNA topoisomerase-2
MMLHHKDSILREESSRKEYTVKNDIQHVLDCSDVYVGDTGANNRKEYAYSDSTGRIEQIETEVPEALVRIFVETLTNAVDNAERSRDTAVPCTLIQVSLNVATGTTSICNDGRTIPVIKNKDQCGAAEPNDASSEFDDLYVHSMIFGNLRSSSNYDGKTNELSGKNGVGIKCTNIFSKYFRVVGVDHERHLKLEQEWRSNMTSTTGPKVKHTSKKRGYTKVEYVPDFARFGLEAYPAEIYSMFKKLVVDVAALLPDVDFTFCDEKIKIKSMVDYAKLYYDQWSGDSISVKYRGSEVLIVGSDSTRKPVSFVNGQITKDGGMHVQSWSKTFFAGILEHVNHKQDIKLAKGDVSPYFQFFIHSKVNKPKFDGQNKHVLKNPKVDSKLEPNHFKKVLKWSVVTTIKEKILRSKELLALKKIEGGKQKVTISSTAYDPANKLGPESVLIVCEGLSAKSYAVTGIQTGVFGKVGRNHFGILPLTGKFLNVKNTGLSNICSNKVVSDLIKVLNLKFKTDYSRQQNYNSLNYGTLLILTDADKDGIHIKGLLINFLHELFPTLLKRKRFVVSMETPIVKVRVGKGKQDLLFYDENTFDDYRQSRPDIAFKYYKGLGTISPKDAPTFFGKKMVEYNLKESCDSKINKVFGDQHANDRKAWLNNYQPSVSNYCLDTMVSNDPDNTTVAVFVGDFMEHEMIKYSYEDCRRSLSSCVDGLKESQRKVIYAVKKKFKKQTGFVKVAQLSGYVAEHTDYKHGEQNLCETIIKFAQSFVGTNNVCLLEADGQFGTRLEGGKDSAASRYIYTRPSKILKYLFREEDDPILEYSNDGEPIFFVPVLPMTLVNGSVGIGTGWSCFVPQYNPMQLLDHIYTKIKHGLTEPLTLSPFYKNFKGKIKPADDNTKKYVTYGKMTHVNEKDVKVTELPIGMWTDKFKESCHSLVEKGLASKVVNESTVDEVSFTLKNVKDVSKVKLTSNLHTSNMVLFNHENVITKYNTIDCILEEYYRTRMRFYELRKRYLVAKLTDGIQFRENKLKFILKVIDDETVLKQDESAIILFLESNSYLKVDGSFNYILNIPIRGFTVNAVRTLEESISKLKLELEEIQNSSAGQVWLRELDAIRPLLLDN